MSNKIFCLALRALLLALGFPAEAQQPPKVLKIGYLSAQSGARGSRGRANEVVRRELHALGHIEGRNIVFEHRYAGNKLERLPALADELAHLNVDLILATSTSAALAAKKATGKIPIRRVWI
jgi:putative tryptophan/tyrosine transport system substrate-binding protein